MQDGQGGPFGGLTLEPSPEGVNCVTTWGTELTAEGGVFQADGRTFKTEGPTFWAKGTSAKVLKSRVSLLFE